VLEPVHPGQNERDSTVPAGPTTTEAAAEASNSSSQ